MRKTFGSLFLLLLPAAAPWSRSARSSEHNEEESTASPADPAREGRARICRLSPAERRRPRSLRCGPGSARMPGREGHICARKPSYNSWTSTSLMTVADFYTREEWCVASAQPSRRSTARVWPTRAAAAPRRLLAAPANQPLV